MGIITVTGSFQIFLVFEESLILLLTEAESFDLVSDDLGDLFVTLSLHALAGCLTAHALAFFMSLVTGNSYFCKTFLIGVTRCYLAFVIWINETY